MRFAYSTSFFLLWVMTLHTMNVLRHRFPKTLDPKNIAPIAPSSQQLPHVHTTDKAHVHNNNENDPKLICIVITFMRSSDPQKTRANDLTMRMYKTLPAVLPLLALSRSSPDNAVDAWLSAGNAESSILKQTQCNEHGTPLVSSLFEQAEEKCPASVPFVAYANADILFDNGLTQTLEMVRDWQPKSGIMIVGRRSNVDMAPHFSTNAQQQLRDVFNAQSELFMEWAQDYFITTRRLVDWPRLPPYVIGRRAYDNALVDWAFHNAILVDATETIKAVHQTLADGNFAGQSDIHADKEYNANLPGGAWDHGATSGAAYKTAPSLGRGLQILDQKTGTQVFSISPGMVYMGTHRSFESIPDPAIVVFGNDSYLPFMLNMLCNLRHFPRMLQHTLMVVPDAQTAQALLDSGVPITVAVSPFESVQGEHDYYTDKYRDILVWRANTLLTLLAREKTVLCMEADVIVYQDLLDQPELRQSTDLTLFWDHTVYGAGFVLFAPTQHAKQFYVEVLKILVSKTEMDNEAITRLVQSSSVTFGKFERCRYRSGASFKFPEQFEDCAQIPVVVQQLNWVVGMQAKIQLAQAHRGWFLQDQQQCAQRDLRAVIMTMDRADSLSRLLQSIQQADASTMKTDIHVSVDVGSDGIPDKGVMQAIAKAHIAWGERGFFTYKVWERPVGIFGNWVDAWEAELYQPDLYKAVVLLEDDLELSPHFAKWFIGAHQTYAGPGVGSVTGQRAQLVAKGGGGNFENLGDINAFAYRLMATWSHSPTHANWAAFRAWVKPKHADSQFRPYVDGITPTDWYRKFEAKGTQHTMWEMWYLKFCELHNCFTVYPWVDHGGKTVACNWREKGLHYDGNEAQQCDFPLMQQWDPNLLLQKPLPFYDWDVSLVQQQHSIHIPEAMRKTMLSACPVHSTCHNVASDSYLSLLAEEEAERTSAQRDTLLLNDAWIHPEGHVLQCNGQSKAVGGGSCHSGPPPDMTCDATMPSHKTVVVITHYWGQGYFHFFVESLPRLAQFADEHPDLKHNVEIHIPENGGAKHAAEMVALLGFPNTVSGSIRADRVFIPPPTPCGGHVHGPHMPRLRSMLRHALGDPAPVASKLILIKRAGRRSISNHDQLLASLQKHWDVVVHLGEGTFVEQLTVFASASVVVGPHGAGLANIMVMQPGAKVYEFIPVQGGLNVCYTVLAVTLGLQYFTNYEPASDSESSWDVDVDHVVRVLSQTASGPTKTQQETLVYFYKYATDDLPPQHYAWDILHSSSQKNKGQTVFLTNIATRHIENVRMAGLQDSEDLKVFRSVYRPWGLEEPWEQHNLERFFYLSVFMKREKLQAVFYFDSDVLLTDTLPRIDPSCDSVVDLEGGHPRMQAATMYWAVWAGTAFLKAAVLDDFIQFTLKVYSSDSSMKLLEKKKAEAPYVCDMTLWYLFVAKAEMAAQWGFDASSLPETKRWHFCDSQALGFDHQHGHTRNNGQGLRSIHFQGELKADIGPFLARSPAASSILLYPKQQIDNFWGAGHTELMLEIGNKCSTPLKQCSFVSECETAECLQSLDAVLFISGIPGRVDTEARQLFAKKKPRISAVWNTEKDNDESRAQLDRQLFGRRISYSFDADIDTSQACDGMLQLRDQLTRGISRKNRKGTIGVISNCGAAFRNTYITNMMLHTDIDHYGDCFRNMQNTDRERSRAEWHDSKIKMMRGYMFALAMENNKEPGYITEKIFDAYIAGAIPVFYGTEDVFKYMPRASMLYVEDFASEKALAQHMAHIQRNASLYMSYFKWGIEHVNETIEKFKCGTHVLCQFCDLARAPTTPATG